jgi:CarD family transcriptional regulator, regulator of rRNA transcription
MGLPERVQNAHFGCFCSITLVLRGPSIQKKEDRLPSATTFQIGDKVVYPHHGAAIIKSMEEKEFQGEKKQYYILRLAYGDLTLMVPTDNTDGVGIRDVIAQDELEKVFKVLKSKECRMPTNWSRRFKTHVEKLRSGDIYQVAEVVRNLARREADKGLSAGEKRMLTKARQILISEVTFAANVDEIEAGSMLDKVLAG